MFLKIDWINFGFIKMLCTIGMLISREPDVEVILLDHMTRILTYSSFCKFSNSIREKTKFCHLMSLKILRGFG